MISDLPLAQLAVVLVGIQTSVSGAVLAKLAEYDVVLLVCDWRGIPIAGTMPWAEHTRVGARHRAQAGLSLPRKKSAWQQTVRAKILGQANTLERLHCENSQELNRIANEVRSGDTTNREAVAAKLYWASINLEEGFRREPGAGDQGLNSCLDYAYTVLRGHAVRAVISGGLSGPLGIFHRGRSNPFALADDLIEPFRPAVDHFVLSNVRQFDPAVRETKALLVDAVNQQFKKTGESIPTSLIELAQEFGLYVEGNRQRFEVTHWSI
ncbi:CRISPR-associated endonuclease Cas1 [Corynebacterium kalinowskii]|uniref:CRISPR-associated endonuclease Cas1 n=1 Tax=Corynebacterium kalinowskii TaxID=2675216 RepID=A0A6B8VT23_9CORY|nr:CRISPR-associated endonuclease Cas1 [Corynebacterium kalinowskii]